MAPRSKTKLEPFTGHFVTMMLIMLGMIGPFAFQIFLPSMPGLAEEYGTSTAAVQLTVSLYLVTYAFAQLLLGPLADWYGRRKVIVVGLAAYMAGAFVCATALSIEVLAAGRILQAVGGCCGLMFSRVIARDLYEWNCAAGVIGFITMMTAFAGSMTPMIGGWVDVTVGWRVNFWCTLVLGLFVFTVILLRLPETRPDSGAKGAFEKFRRGIRQLRSPVFLGYAGHGACTLSAWYAIVSGLPYVMVDILNQPITAYGVYFPLLSIGYMAGNLVTARFALNWGTHRLIMTGVAMALSACAIMIVWNMSVVPHPLALFLPMALIVLGHGMSQPSATSGAIGVDMTVAGSAAGLMGFGQWLVAATIAQLVGMIQNGTVWPTVSVVIVLTLFSGMSYLLARWGERRAMSADVRIGA